MLERIVDVNGRNLGCTDNDLSNLFDPNKNTILQVFRNPSVTYGTAFDFLRNFFGANRDLLIEEFKRHGYPNVDAFLNSVPYDKHWLLMLAVKHGSSSIRFDCLIGEIVVTVYNQGGVTSGQQSAFNSFVDRVESFRSNTISFYDFFYQTDFWLSKFVAWVLNACWVEYSGNTKLLHQLHEKDKVFFKLVGSTWMLTMEKYVDPNDRSAHHRVYNYSQDVTQLIPGPYEDKRGGTLYGVELEMSTDYREKDIIDAFPDLYGILKSDSSVTGSKMNRWEFVSKPASLRQHKIQWAGFFKKLELDKFDMSDKHNNGFHVHVDRQAFESDTMHLKKFAWFFTNPVNHEFLFIMSNRDRHSLDSYSRIVNAKSVVHAERQAQSGGKMTALNFGKPKTIEVRLFKGIVSFATILMNLELVDSLVEYTRVASYSKCDFQNYLEWLDFHSGSSYRSLRLCLKEHDFSRLLIIGKIKSAFSAGMKPREIQNTLNRIEGVQAFKEEVMLEFTQSIYAMDTNLEFDPQRGLFVCTRATTKYAKFDDMLLQSYNFAA